jgi:hypothetical protein
MKLFDLLKKKSDPENGLPLNPDLTYMVQTIKMVSNFLKESGAKKIDPEKIIDFIQRMSNVLESYHEKDQPNQKPIDKPIDEPKKEVELQIPPIIQPPPTIIEKPIYIPYSVPIPTHTETDFPHSPKKIPWGNYDVYWGIDKPLKEYEKRHKNSFVTMNQVSFADTNTHKTMYQMKI